MLLYPVAVLSLVTFVFNFRSQKFREVGILDMHSICMYVSTCSIRTRICVLVTLSPSINVDVAFIETKRIVNSYQPY